jgi:type I restriction enzyme M protein
VTFFGRGLAVPTLFVEQISYLIYLKLLDEREAELEVKARLLRQGRRGNFFPDQASGYAGVTAFKSGNDFAISPRRGLSYMASLLKESHRLPSTSRTPIGD